MALGDLARRRQRPLDRRDVAVGAVGGEAEPERQPASAPGEVDGEIRWIAGLPVDLVQIARKLRVSGARGLGIAVEERAAVVGGEEPLVRVDDEAVGELDAVEEAADAGGGERRSAVGAVDVEPDPALGAHRGDARQVVHEARVRRPGGGHDREDVVGALSSAASRASPLRRPLSSSSTSRIPTSSTRAATRMEECTSAVQASFHPPGGRSPRRDRAACRAAASAERFPPVPPATKQPAALGGQPSSSMIQPSASFSA